MDSLSNGRVQSLGGAHRRCLGFKEPDGEPCEAYPMKGSDFCFQHDPALEAERQALIAGQGRRAGSPIVPQTLPLETPADVRLMLQKVAEYLLAGERIEPRRVTALTGVADRLLRAMSLADLQSELAAAHRENEDLQARCADYERLLAESEPGPRPAPAAHAPAVGERSAGLPTGDHADLLIGAPCPSASSGTTPPALAGKGGE